MQERSVAILIDGGYFLKRLRHLLPNAITPELQVAAIMRLCKSHLAQLAGLAMPSKPDSQNMLRFAYRIFYVRSQTVGRRDGRRALGYQFCATGASSLTHCWEVK